MAEAEDVLTDAARHATVYAQALWRRHRPVPQPPGAALADLAPRLDLLLAAVFGAPLPLRVAAPPAPPTLLARWQDGWRWAWRPGPRQTLALPATDGVALWLPPRLADTAGLDAAAQYRVIALQQAMRARRGDAAQAAALADPLARSLGHLLAAQAADAALLALLPGLAAPLRAWRALALRRRPPLAAFPPQRAPLEAWLRALLAVEPTQVPPHDADAIAALAAALRHGMGAPPHPAGALLHPDLWTGVPRLPAPLPWPSAPDFAAAEPPGPPPRSARLPRRPEVRQAPPDEDERQPGAWMVQTAQPHEQAEDPAGLQRPTDRDAATAAEDFADALSELPEARLVSAPGRPKEVLLADDAPTARARAAAATRARDGAQAAVRHLDYPEWDWRLQAYRSPGARVHLAELAEGPQAWVDATLARHPAMAQAVRRQFEQLRAQRVRLRRQADGEDIDLAACIDALADLRAGLALPTGLYQAVRAARRDLAVLLLVDVSGSTDAWVSAHRRIIDVEREALLLVSLALEGLAAPSAILAFSGEGPQGVVVRSVKAFDQPHGAAVARRIAALEPEHYTRAGAALRHATALLMRQPVQHRLLLLLSDGKPNDVDEYDGRYGVEDLRQAVVEATLQGVHPFCLTVDRQAASYVGAVFGAHRHALLPQPERLPAVLLDWMRRWLGR